MRAIVAALLLGPWALACDGDGAARGGPDAGPPAITFCGDRVDDDGDDRDENCPSTQPADAAPAYECDANPPDNVVAYAAFEENAQVSEGCVFVYQGETGAYYASVKVLNGQDVFGPMGESQGKCRAYTSARRHVFMTTSPVGDCPIIEFQHPDQVTNQLLSNDCRKMLRNQQFNDPGFDPDVQYLDGDLAAQRYRLAQFDTVEVACTGLNRPSGEPYANDSVFVTQATTTWTTNPDFVER